jgi:hypothetical protein
MQGANPGGTLASGFQGMVDAADQNMQRRVAQEQADFWRYGMGRQKSGDQREDQALAEARQAVSRMQFTDPAERAAAMSDPLGYIRAKGAPLTRKDERGFELQEREIGSREKLAEADFRQRERFHTQDLGARYAALKSNERINNFEKSFETAMGRGDAAYLTNLSGVYRQAQITALPALRRMRSIITKYQDDPEFMGGFLSVVTDPENAGKVEAVMRRWSPEKIADFQMLSGDQSFFASEKAKEMHPVTDFDQKIALRTTAGPQMVAPAALAWLDNREQEIVSAGKYLEVARSHLKGGRGLGDADEQEQTFDQKISGLRAPAAPAAPPVRQRPPADKSNINKVWVETDENGNEVRYKSNGRGWIKLDGSTPSIYRTK